jgi:type IV secretion system protein VirD4
MKRPFYLFFVIGLVFAISYAYLLSIYYDFNHPLDYLISVKIGGFYFWLMVGPMIAIWGLFVLISDSKVKSNYGDSKWATKRDIKKMKLFADTGMIFGIFKGKFIRSKEPLSVLIAAPPGTGKTTTIAVPILLTCDYSMIINDIKNELWKLTSNFRKKHQKVIRFAPAEEESSKWNAFSELPEEFSKQIIFLNRIASVLYPTTGNSDKDHWPRNARTIFVFFAMVSILENDDLSFTSIRSRILDTDDIQEFVAEYIDDFQERDDEALNKFMLENVNSILQFEKREFGSVVSTCRTALDIFNDPFISKNTSETDFNIQELRDGKVSIYLCSNMEDAERITPITRLFLELTTTKLLSDKPKDDQKVLILADEFIKMGKMDKLVSTPDLSRGQKLIVIFIVQSFNQIKQIYGENGANTLISTTAHKVIFTQNDQISAKMASDWIGKKTVKKLSISQSNNWKSAGKNKSISEEGQPLILPQDIGSLTDDQVIIIAQGHNTSPIMAKTCKYYKISALKKLVS